MRVAVVRDRWLNLWDVGNYYGLTEHGVELTFWGRNTGNGDIPWGQLGELYPRALFKMYRHVYEVAESGPDILDLPDAHFEFTQKLVGRGIKSFIVAFDNVPGKNTVNAGALKALQDADGHIARSALARHALIFDGVPDSRIRRIPGAVDTKHFRPLPNVKRENAVLFVGRLVNEKGLESLMWAMKELPGTELWVVGSGPEEMLLKKWSDWAGIAERTKWKGVLDRNALADIYRRARVLAVPSVPKMGPHPYSTWLEQFGQVIIEGLASGLPIVGSNAGSIPEVGGSTAGLYQPPLHWPDMTRNLNDALYGRGTWDRMSRAARKRATLYYDQVEVAEKLIAWYNVAGE
jgi:glycosyltransferase involved in cell wall biosynthesis